MNPRRCFSIEEPNSTHGQGERLDEFEQLLIQVLLGLGEIAYGMTIRRESERTAGRHVTLGSVYWTLDRLEEKGLVSSFYGNPAPIRGDRPRRYFKVEELAGT